MSADDRRHGGDEASRLRAEVSALVELVEDMHDFVTYNVCRHCTEFCDECDLTGMEGTMNDLGVKWE